MSIPDEKVQEVRDRVDITDLVGRYVSLRKAGRNYKGLCPFHDEKTPSFNVNPERKGYKCFGCGAGGDAIRFVMEVEGKSFPEAVRKLAELYGVTLPSPSGPSSPSRTHEKDEAYRIMNAAADFYETLLFDDPVGQTGRAYLQKRKIGSDIARAFRLGYAPDPTEAAWDTLVRVLEQQKRDLSMAEALGLVGRSERTGNQYDKFRGRLMFPVIQPGGEVIAFSGRIVPPHDEPAPVGAGQPEREPPKYINSPESLLFHKSKVLFGLATARSAIRAGKRAILVEGNIDVVQLHQWEHKEVVAPLGTALTEQQARLLSRFAEQVIMCFDGDKAGKKAAWAALPHLLQADLDVRMVMLPEGEDPDSVGAERFGALLEHAKPALEEMIIRIAARAGKAAHARARGLDRVVPLIAAVSRDSAREIYADRAAELFELPSSRVLAAVRASRSGASAGPSNASTQEKSRQFSSTSRGPVPVSAAVRPMSPLPVGQSQLTMLLVDLPHLASLAESIGALECVTDARLRPIFEAVIDGAKRGEEPAMTDLLERVDASAQRQVYDAVFSGGYRGQEATTDDPQAILQSLVRRCREEALNQRIDEVEQEFATARERGYADKATELAQLRLELRRQQDALRHQHATEATNTNVSSSG